MLALQSHLLSDVFGLLSPSFRSPNRHFIYVDLNHGTLRLHRHRQCRFSRKLFSAFATVFTCFSLSAAVCTQKKPYRILTFGWELIVIVLQPRAFLMASPLTSSSLSAVDHLLPTNLISENRISVACSRQILNILRRGWIIGQKIFPAGGKIHSSMDRGKTLVGKFEIFRWTLFR